MKPLKVIPLLVGVSLLLGGCVSMDFKEPPGGLPQGPSPVPSPSSVLGTITSVESNVITLARGEKISYDSATNFLGVYETTPEVVTSLQGDFYVDEDGTLLAVAVDNRPRDDDNSQITFAMKERLGAATLEKGVVKSLGDATAEVMLDTGEEKEYFTSWPLPLLVLENPKAVEPGLCLHTTTIGEQPITTVEIGAPEALGCPQ